MFYSNGYKCLLKDNEIYYWSESQNKWVYLITIEKGQDIEGAIFDVFYVNY